MIIRSGSLLLWLSTSPLSAAFVTSNFASNRRFSKQLVFISRWHPSYPRNSMNLSMSTTGSTSTTSSLLRIALCQFPVTHQKTVNEQTAKDYLTRAKKNGAQLAVLPEIWNSPYATSAFPDYAEKLPEIGDSSVPADASTSSQLLLQAAKDLDMWIIGGSVPEVVTASDQTKIYNTCLVVNREGTVVAKHRKVHLFDIDVPGGITFFESETLSAGSTFSHFSTPFGEIGVGICYDIRFAEYALLLRQKYNCVILVYPGAFNMTTGPAHWELLQCARAIDNQCFVVTASPARTEKKDDDDKDDAGKSKYPHYTAWGHSTIVSPWGDIVATADENERLVVADLDLSRVEEVRSGIPIGHQRRVDMYTLEDCASKHY